MSLSSESTAVVADEPRCTHFTPCPCPLLPEYALRRFKKQAWFLAWKACLPNENTPRKVVPEKAKRRCWRYMLRHMSTPFTNLFLKIKRSPEESPKSQWARWAIESHHVPEGYHGRPAPWCMLVRIYLKDLPKQLREANGPGSVKSWRTISRTWKWKTHHRDTWRKTDPEVTCVRQEAFSLWSRHENRTVLGGWFVVVYLWARDHTWAHQVDVRDLISFCSVCGIFAWEWVDAVDAPAQVPYMFYELERGKNGVLQDTVFGGNAYQNHGSVPMQPGDPLPTRLLGLRRLMNGEARRLLYADYEF